MTDEQDARLREAWRKHGFPEEDRLAFLRQLRASSIDALEGLFDRLDSPQK